MRTKSLTRINTGDYGRVCVELVIHTMYSGGDSPGGEEVGVGGDDPKEVAKNEICKGIIARTNHLIREFLKEWKKYDPDADARGGFPMSGGRTTKPFGHWQEMKQLQNGMRNRANEYDRNCNDRNDGRGGRGGMFPEQARSMSRQHIPRLAGPNMFEQMGMSPENAAKAAAAAAVIYWIFSGASRLYPPRNLVPVP